MRNCWRKRFLPEVLGVECLQLRRLLLIEDLAFTKDV